MSLSDVRDSFDTLFSDATLQAITPKIYDYDILEDSNLDNRKYRYQQKINFFIYNITKSIEKKQFGCEQEIYNAEIKYYLEDKKNGSAQNDIRDAFETVHSKIKTVIGNTWDSSVDFYLTTDDPISVNTIDLGGRQAWVGTYNYQGYKQI